MLIDISNGFQHSLDAGLLHLAAHQVLIQDVVGLVEIKDQIEFADVAKVAIQCLYIPMDDLQCQQLVLLLINTCDKIEACISKINGVSKNSEFFKHVPFINNLHI